MTTIGDWFAKLAARERLFSEENIKHVVQFGSALFSVTYSSGSPMRPISEARGQIVYEMRRISITWRHHVTLSVYLCLSTSVCLPLTPPLSVYPPFAVYLWLSTFVYLPLSVYLCLSTFSVYLYLCTSSCLPLALCLWLFDSVYLPVAVYLWLSIFGCLPVSTSFCLLLSTLPLF